MNKQLIILLILLYCCCARCGFLVIIKAQLLSSDNALTNQRNVKGGTELSSVISTFAGTGDAGFSGDGGPATRATIKFSRGVAVAPNGNVYIADTRNERIRMVDTNGIISTIAGTGKAGYSGDGGPATSAGIDNPKGITVSPNGEVFFTDFGNNVVRKISLNGIISTIAGNGKAGFSGDGGPATSAMLDSPTNLIVSTSGNVFISDGKNNRIRKVDINGIISTIAGTGDAGFSGDGGPATSAQLSYPDELILTPSGELVFADYSNDRIRKIDTNGIISTIAGNGESEFGGDGGPATSASLNGPLGIVFGLRGELYISDKYNQRIRMVDTNGIISTFAGTGVAGESGDGGDPTLAQIRLVESIDFRDNILYMAESGNDRIRIITSYAKKEEISCFGYLSNDTLNVCSGHGQCVSNNTCQCSNRWIGGRCETATCFHYASYDPIVCGRLELLALLSLPVLLVAFIVIGIIVWYLIKIKNRKQDSPRVSGELMTPLVDKQIGNN